MSHFQNLPYLVSSKIFGYFIYNVPKPSFDDDPIDINPFCSLLWSCQKWRHIALCYLLEKQEVNIGIAAIESAASSWPNDLDMPVAPFTNLVKTLVLNIRLPKNYSFENVFPNGILDGLPLSMVYNNARLVEAYVITPSYYYSSYLNDKYMCSNIAMLTQYVKQVAPNACDLQLHSMLPPHYEFGSGFVDLLSEFLLSLVDSIAKRKLTVTQVKTGAPVDLGTMDNIEPLTHIRINRPNDDWMVELIRRCAETLKVLELHNCSFKDNISGVLKDTKDNYVVYSNMKQLLIGVNECEHTDIVLSSFPGAAPFPNLQRLICPYKYPFGDDAVFRGNRDALKYVDLKLDPQLVGVLIHNNVFSASSYPRLIQAKIRQNDMMYTHFTYDDCARLVYKIGRDVLDLTLEFEEYDYIEPQHFTSSRLLGQNQLQKLCIDRYELRISSVIMLLESLPNLAELATCFKPIEEQLVPMYLQKLIDQHYPLGPKLQILSELNKKYLLRKSCPKTMLALVALCPNICVLKVEDKAKTNKLQNSLNTFLNQEGYGDYSRRFETLKVIRYFR